MNRHTSSVEQVSSDSYLVFVNQFPVFHSYDPSEAIRLQKALEELFANADHDFNRISPIITQGRIGIGCPKRVPDNRTIVSPHIVTFFFELSAGSYSSPWQEAEVLAENVRSALYFPSFLTRKKQFVGIKETPESSTVEKAPVVVPEVAPGGGGGGGFFLMSPPTGIAILPEQEEILDRVPTEGGTVLLYKKETDDLRVYAGLEISIENKYALDAVSTLITRDTVDVSIIKLFGESSVPVLRLSGVHGANSIRTFYYALEATGPKELIAVDGTVYEIDLDNDGNKEIISVSGNPTFTRTYMWSENRFVEVNITLSIAATSAAPSEIDPSIIEKSEKGEVVERYKMEFVRDGAEKNVVLEEI